MAELAAAPTSRRIESLDFVRGCALFGILLMNIVAMGMTPAAYDNPAAAGGHAGPDLWVWVTASIGFEGTQRALFSMLFGAGAILLSTKLEKSGRTDATDIYFRRQLLLIGFGLFNAWVLLWFGDILYTYGIIALFLFAFRKLAGKTLLAIGVGALVLAAAWNTLDAFKTLGDYESHAAASSVPEASRTKEQTAAIENWNGQQEQFIPSEAALSEQRAAETGSYWSALEARAPFNTMVQSWWLYRYFFDVFGMMMIGMALYRLGVLTLDVPNRVYWAMLLGGYAVGLSVNIAEVRWIMANEFSMLAFKQAAISYDLGRLSMTIGHLGLLLLFVRSGALSWLRRSMAAVGRMALTNYLTHSLVALVFFNFLGFWGLLQRHELYFIVGAVWAFQIVVSPIWLNYYHFGPVEWLWRYLTYGARPPFRRHGTATPPGVSPVPAA